MYFFKIRKKFEVMKPLFWAILYKVLLWGGMGDPIFNNYDFTTIVSAHGRLSAPIIVLVKIHFFSFGKNSSQYFIFVMV